MLPTVKASDKSTLTNNSSTVMNRGKQSYGRGKGHGHSSHSGHQKGHKGQRSFTHTGKGKGKNHGTKGKGKGKGKTHPKTVGNRHSDLCGYCQNLVMKVANAVNGYTTKNKKLNPPDGIRLELHWMDARVTTDESGYSIIFRLSLF